ncbi:MAG: aldehyde dehydrogenase family protein [Myxococcota bacterium]|nr:aldehyde dehydrogenase family protein [Myxococcota bacterium]
MNRGHFINGHESPGNGARFEVLDPATCTVMGSAAQGTDLDIDQAVEAARQAQPRWWNLPPGERERILLRCADHLEHQGSQLIDTLLGESGSTLGKASFEVNYTPALLRAAAGEARRLYGDTFLNDRPDRMSMVIREPVGVVGVISPFNAPLALLVKMVAFPLAAGNTVVAKPSEHTPLVAIHLAELMHEAGLPDGVFNVVTGFGAQTGKRLVEHPDVGGIAFTGSTAVGAIIGAEATRRMKRLQLELGGKNPVIVLADMNPAEAAAEVARGAFFHGGQICMSGSRVIVEASIMEEFTAALVAEAQALKLGDLRSPETAYGPLICEDAIQRVDNQVQTAVASGARLATGGRVHAGWTYAPTVLIEPPRDSEVWREETFGPVVSVVEAADLDAAIATANDTVYGLSSAVLTRDMPRALHAARRLRSGAVHLGMHSFQSNTMAPVGGVGASGIGRSGGQYSIEHFTEQKWISLDIGAPPALEVQ